ncbi:hypothetical protein DB347_07560 [Opitutaceae bacterium EW11]|nr:hypothetical protein DB347_07560 [Opitutaceae bacterium EW11]
MNAPAQVRFHALDALRAFALLLGVCFHAAISFTAPGGIWAVGTSPPETFAAIFVYYVHTFRMEVFFLLAGFFARLVIGRRGVWSFARDRTVRIALVFAVALYPMKIVLAAIWITGGRLTGWLKLPPEAAGLPTWKLALGAQGLEHWPNINLTHLWFLYYLMCITALALVFRGLATRVLGSGRPWGARADGAFRRIVAGGWSPWVLALSVFPLVLLMKGTDVDTPDKGFGWHVPVLALYALFFAVGWMLQRQPELVAAFGRRWPFLLLASLAVGWFSIWCIGQHYAGASWTTSHRHLARVVIAAGTSLTMCLAVTGWLGLFVRCFDRARPWVRYLADSAYWVYLSHLPLVVALQVAVATWSTPWWAKWILINLIAAAVLFPSYHWFVRRTWLGLWINGRRIPANGYREP